LSVTGSNPVSASFNSANGGSIVFSGTGSYATFGTPSSLNFERTNSFSVCAFLNTTNTNNVANNIIGNSSTIVGTLNIGWYFTLFNRAALKATSVNLSLVNNGANNLIEVTSPQNSILPNTWYYICATYDGSSSASGVTIYINGVTQTSIITSNTLSATIQNANAIVLAARASLDQNFPGSIATIQMYNRVLSAAEVAQNYNAQKSRFGLL